MAAKIQEFWGAGLRADAEKSGRRWRLGAILVPLVLLLLCAAAAADDAPESKTIVVFGDSQAQGVASGLQRLLLENPRFRVLNRTHPGAALVHDDDEWLGPIRKFTQHEKADFAVVMFGANDRLDMRLPPAGTYLHFRSDAWRAEYTRRTDQILQTLVGAGLKIIWLGNPIARSAKYSEDMVYINEILAQEAIKFGAQYFPLWHVIADEQGDYTAYGKDLEGVVTRLRTDDGIHFTAAGYELIADRIMTLLPKPAPDASPQ